MKFKIFFFLFFLTCPSFLYSHVNHYDKIEYIEMDVLRNGKKIGYNKYIFGLKNDLSIVKNEANFIAKFAGFNLLSISGSSIETYKNGKLIKFQSSTSQNKKKNTMI